MKVRYDAESIAFIQRHASQGATASVCTGALILAQAGLLDEKRATTHSSLLNLLREYPKVQVIENIRFIFQGNVATSAGITAGIDLSLELLKRTYDDQLVGEIVKEMEYRR